MFNIEDQPYTAPVDPSPLVSSTPFSWWGLLGMILVFLIIMFTSLLIIKAIRKSTMGIGNARWVRVLDRQHLGGQQMLYLVEVAGKLQVLGGSDHSLVKITEIEDAEVAAEILADISTRPFEDKGGIFSTMFDKVAALKRRKDFSLELEELMREARNENRRQHED